MVSDYVDDWLLLTQALITPERLRLPVTLQSREFVPAEVVQHPTFRAAQAAVYSLDWVQHHALADARGLRAGLLAWQEALKQRL